MTIALREQRTEISFSGQKMYEETDVHLKSWSVTVLSETSVLKKFCQNSDPETLYGFLTRSSSSLNAIPYQIALLERRTHELKALNIEILNLAKRAAE